MKKQIRVFNTRGIERFSAFLKENKGNGDVAIPTELLYDESCLEKVSVLTGLKGLEVEGPSGRFQTRREAGEYLCDLLKPISFVAVRKSQGLWSWLSLFYFDSVAPFDEKKGNRPIYDYYRYLYEPGLSRYYYRNLLFTSWYVCSIAPHSRLMLDTKVSSLDKGTDTFVKALNLQRIRCIPEVLDRLYWDEERQRPKPGIVSNNAKPGNLEFRFPTRIRQLEVTYDLNSLDADKLIRLLGKEFEFEADVPNERDVEVPSEPDVDVPGEREHHNTWKADMLDILRRYFVIGKEFTLGNVMSHAPELAAKHPNNQNIDAKICQLLQFLRDDGVIEFLERGHYRRIR